MHSRAVQAMAAHHNWEETRKLRLQIEAAPHWDNNFDATLCSVPKAIPSWLPNSVAKLFGQEYDAKSVITNLAKERAANPTVQQLPYPSLSSYDSFADRLIGAGVNTARAAVARAGSPSRRDIEQCAVTNGCSPDHDTYLRQNHQRWAAAGGQQTNSRFFHSRSFH